MPSWLPQVQAQLVSTSCYFAYRCSADLSSDCGAALQIEFLKVEFEALEAEALVVRQHPMILAQRLV